MHCALRWRLIDKKGWRKKRSIGNELVTNRLKWAGHVDRVGGERLAESRRTERRGEKEVMKSETAVGGLREKRPGVSGRGMEKKIRR